MEQAYALLTKEQLIAKVISLEIQLENSNHLIKLLKEQIKEQSNINGSFFDETSS